MHNLDLKFSSLLNVLLVSGILYAGTEISQFTTELMLLRKSFIVDLDRARQQLLEDVKYAYITGCKQGVDYPQEFRMSQTGFNINSPNNWCQEQSKSLENYMLEQAYKLGKPIR